MAGHHRGGSLLGHYSELDSLDKIESKFESLTMMEMLDTVYNEDTYGLRILDERFRSTVPGFLTAAGCTTFTISLRRLRVLMQVTVVMSVAWWISPCPLPVSLLTNHLQASVVWRICRLYQQEASREVVPL
jgi:hypothetical protein